MLWIVRKLMHAGLKFKNRKRRSLDPRVVRTKGLTVGKDVPRRFCGESYFSAIPAGLGIFRAIPGSELPGCYGRLSSEHSFFSFFSFFSLKDVFVFFWLRFLFVGSFCLALLQAAIRTRTVSVPSDDSESVKRNEAHPI